jgi:hypothetical protein
MKNTIKSFLALAILGVLCGCARIEVYHKVEHYGNADRGGWQVSMDDFVYDEFVRSDHYRQFMSDARSFSNPTVRRSSGTTYIEDLTGTARMEHIYEEFDCWPDPEYSRYMICEYYAGESGLNYPAWVIDWTVDLEPDMQMLASNHHSARTVNGLRRYTWLFDGSSVSAYEVHYRIRTPRA